jgi:integrase
MAKVRKRTWQTKSGLKSGYIADYFAPDKDGRRKRHIRTFKTRKEATAWLAQAQVEVAQGTHSPPSTSITVREAGHAWIAKAAADGLERSTVRQYEQHLAHLLPILGPTKLSALTPAGVQNFRNRLIAEGRSRVMAERILSSLGSILAGAMAVNQVARNVVREQARHNRRRAHVEKRHKRHLQVGVDIPTKTELNAMIEHAGKMRPLLLVAIFTGLRASELRGLTWDAVDLIGATLTVRQRADRWNTMGPPKSSSGKRTVPLAPMVVHALKEWRLACPKGELGLVFPNSEGNVQSLPNLHRRGLGPLQFAAGITTAAEMRATNPELTEKHATAQAKLRPKYGLHSFRHAAASLFIEQGYSPKRVQALMGHSSIQMTFDVYGHLFPSEKDDQAQMAMLQASLIG